MMPVICNKIQECQCFGCVHAKEHENCDEGEVDCATLGDTCKCIPVRQKDEERN